MTGRSIALMNINRSGGQNVNRAEMELMQHPNRSKMVQVALELLPFPPQTTALRANRLGIGTVYLSLSAF